MAADVTIAQVSETVELGALDPEHVITPGIFVQHVVQIQPASTQSASAELSNTATTATA